MAKKKTVKKGKKIIKRLGVVNLRAAVRKKQDLPAMSAQARQAESKKIETKKSENIETGETTNHGRTERDKELMMWAGVIFFMVLIFSFWIFNVRNIFKVETNNSNEAGQNQFNWDELRDEFSQTMVQIKEGMEEVKKLEVNQPVQTEGEGAEEAGDESIGLDKDELKELKSRLEEMEERFEVKK